EQALTLFGDSRIMPVVLGKTRQITEYGSTHRIFTEGQRLAMIARDLGCSFPGCTAPPAWCQAHHITDFSLTRRTSVDDGTLLCGFHHREHPRLGWTCRMINGNPHWTAPGWLDPTQTPRRNRIHDPLGV
ncbi:MAG TPA: HNH endonuclease signature motif containing protein, partial [Jatrophihabitantaceae bacterium]